MIVKIFFKIKIKPIIIRDVVSIICRNIDPKIDTKVYTKDRLINFVPFENESYAFKTTNTSVSVKGSDILYVFVSNDENGDNEGLLDSAPKEMGEMKNDN